MRELLGSGSAGIFILQKF